MASLEPQLHQSNKEVDRLLSNWLSLLEIMPDMVVLLGGNHKIFYLNESAKRILGDLQGQSCTENLCNAEEHCQEHCPLKLLQQSETMEQPPQRIETRIGKVDVEYSCVVFQGYLGDPMVMLVFRDVSERKRHEREMLEFHKNIEDVLKVKIRELTESEQTRKRLYQEVNILKRKVSNTFRSDKMIGKSRKMSDLREMIYRVADSDATVLIIGESGTGKELVADLVQSSSRRSDKPFLKVNCSAISDQLLESELFGYEKGAFTGAVSRKKGKFEINNGGTIFLDEIGDISPRMQSSLLRILQNKELIRVGGNEPVSINVRIIAATNVDLLKAVQEGTFRLDLYYRLNTFILEIPPLRERKEDIILLAAHFVRKYRKIFNRQVGYLPHSTIEKLVQHNWPGNVRDLENVIQRAVLLTRDEVISEADICFDACLSSSSVETGPDVGLQHLLLEEEGNGLKIMLAIVEKNIILAALKKTNGNVQQAAAHLKLGKTALYDKIRRYEINPKTLKE